MSLGLRIAFLDSEELSKLPYYFRLRPTLPLNRALFLDFTVQVVHCRRSVNEGTEFEAGGTISDAGAAI